MSYQWYSLIGLTLDMIGVLILFLSDGLPPNLKMFRMYYEMTVKPEWEIKNMRIKRRSLFAFFLLLAGFVFQFIGTALSM